MSFILLTDVAKITGRSIRTLLSDALNEKILLFYHDAGEWQIVPMHAIELVFGTKSAFQTAAELTFSRTRWSYNLFHVWEDDIAVIDQNNPGPVATIIGHKYEPPELVKCIEVWTVLYSSAGTEGRKIRKNTIKRWLRKKYPTISDTEAERIAIVVNPHKKGGATPSGI